MWFRKKEVAMDIDSEILSTKAKLAQAKLTPESDFTIYRPTYEGGIIHGVDRKPHEIATLEAKLAYLEVIKKG